MKWMRERGKKKRDKGEADEGQAVVNENPLSGIRLRIRRTVYLESCVRLTDLAENWGKRGWKGFMNTFVATPKHKTHGFFKYCSCKGKKGIARMTYICIEIF